MRTNRNQSIWDDPFDQWLSFQVLNLDGLCYICVNAKLPKLFQQCTVWLFPLKSRLPTSEASWDLHQAWTPGQKCGKSAHWRDSVPLPNDLLLFFSRFHAHSWSPWTYFGLNCQGILLFLTHRYLWFLFFEPCRPSQRHLIQGRTKFKNLCYFKATFETWVRFWIHLLIFWNIYQLKRLVLLYLGKIELFRSNFFTLAGKTTFRLKFLGFIQWFFFFHFIFLNRSSWVGLTSFFIFLFTISLTL